jgi:hypothetical protein
MKNAKLLALEAELDRIKDLRVDAATEADIRDIQEWLISFRAVFTISTTSRTIMFAFNMFIVCMSVGVCYTLHDLKLWIMASIIIIVPIGLMTSISTVTSIGTMMHITDRHFNDFNFKFSSVNLLPLVDHYDKKTAKKHDDLGIDIDYYGLFNSRNYHPGDPDEFAHFEDPNERPTRAIESLWLSGPVHCEDPPERPSRAVNHGHMFQKNIVDSNTEPSTSSDNGSHDANDTNPIDVQDDAASNVDDENPKDSIASKIFKMFSSRKNRPKYTTTDTTQKDKLSIQISDDHMKTKSHVDDEDDGDDEDAANFSVKDNIKLSPLSPSKSETTNIYEDNNSNLKKSPAPWFNQDFDRLDGNSLTQADLQFFGADDQTSGFRFSDDDDDIEDSNNNQSKDKNDQSEKSNSKLWFSMS